MAVLNLALVARACFLMRLTLRIGKGKKNYDLPLFLLDKREILPVLT